VACGLLGCCSGCLLAVQMFSFEFPRAHREVVRDSNVEIVRDFDSRGRATDVWFRFNNYVVFALEVKHDRLGRIHQWRRKVCLTCIDFLPVSEAREALQ